MMILREPIWGDPQKNPGVPSSNPPDGYAIQNDERDFTSRRNALGMSGYVSDS
jgi:hypothetical protein